MPTPDWVDQCNDLARRIRGHCLCMTHRGKSGHVGSMLSMAEILAVLYHRVLRLNPEDPKWPDRDRFILSKGHGGAAVYAALVERGLIPAAWMDGYYRDGGKLMGHISHHVPFVEFSTGSLGHGLPVACGMAVAAKRTGRKHRVFCLLSDGDCDEGSSWEAMLFAAQHQLDNLTVIVDYNRAQALGTMAEVLELEPFAEKVRAFGWEPREIDGHDVEQLEAALQPVPWTPGKPSWLLCHTTKGKCVDWMEGTVACHYGSVSDDQLRAALEQVGCEPS